MIREHWLAKGTVTENADVPDETYEDGYNTLSAIATLKDMVKKDDKPWFLALGFKKTHLDFIAPKKYWDMYNEADIPIATQVTPPKDGAAMGLSESLEIRVAADMPKTGDFSILFTKKITSWLLCLY
jgi:arylsulfatase A-like enzyme